MGFFDDKTTYPGIRADEVNVKEGILEESHFCYFCGLAAAPLVDVNVRKGCCLNEHACCVSCLGGVMAELAKEWREYSPGWYTRISP